MLDLVIAPLQGGLARERSARAGGRAGLGLLAGAARFACGASGGAEYLWGDWRVQACRGAQVQMEEAWWECGEGGVG